QPWSSAPRLRRPRAGHSRGNPAGDREVTLLFAGAVFLSAFLLFVIQPLAGKALLPGFGGTPGVWTTCMLFFQLVLLAGYGYSHAVVRRLRPVIQARVHGALIVMALLLLPISISAASQALDAGAPLRQILRILLARVGLPYFILSTTGPLLQAWFSRTGS